MGQNRGHEEVSRELQTEEEALRELLSDHNSRHSLSCNSCGVKIGLPENRLHMYEQKSPIEGFQSPKMYSMRKQYSILIG